MMAIFVRRFKIHNCLELILRHNFKYRKLYSYDTAFHNSLKNNLTSQKPLFHIDCKYLTQALDINIQVDSLQISKYLDYLTNSYKNRKGKNDFDDILNVREVRCLVQDRMKLYEDLKSLKELAKDKEMKQIALEEEATYLEQLKILESKLLQTILLNIGQENCTDVILEINSGVGGQEAMLFAKDLLEMYLKHMDYLGFKYEIIETSVAEQGGIRHASITMYGEKTLEIMRHEGGVHRVQRVPATEKFGRVHTSVVSVAIMPQPSEIEVVLHDKDLKIDTKRATGAGGQHVNTTDSAVRITHIPTGTVVECQTQRSQIQNKNIAMLKLRTKIYQKRLAECINSTTKIRKQQMGLGLRHEKIRTYNYNQNRVTDHRLQENGTMYNLPEFLKGGEALSEFQERLQREFEKSMLLEAIRNASSG